MQYRKKPVVIEAWRWLFNANQEPTPVWVSDAIWKWPAIGGIAFEPHHPEYARVCIATLDAVAVASPGDWICKGIRGELYPCKHDIFEETYEPVLEAAKDMS